MSLTLFFLSLLPSLTPGMLSDMLLAAMDGNITSILDLHQTCVKISKIPLPFPYAQLLKLSLFLFLTLAPFSFVHFTAYATPVASFFLAILFFGEARDACMAKPDSDD